MTVKALASIFQQNINVRSVKKQCSLSESQSGPRFIKLQSQFITTLTSKQPSAENSLIYRINANCQKFY